MTDEYIDYLKKIIIDSVKNKEDGEYEMKFYIRLKDHEIDEVSFEHEDMFRPIKRPKSF